MRAGPATPIPFPAAGAPIDPARLEAMMDAVSVFGCGEGGAIMRLALSSEDKAARDWLAGWFRDNGLAPAVDAIGNQFGRLDLAGPEAPVVMVGSHLDSQPNGGRFDGALGVVCACEAVLAVRTEMERRGGSPACNFVIVNWTNEEGARFQPSLLGSSVFTGAAELDWALGRRDGDGMTVGQALDAIGYAGVDTVAVPDAFLELHIEGGPVLERAGRPLGAFTRFWGATKYRLAFIGRQAHTGPTPMAERKDALLAGAYVIAGLKDLAGEYGLELQTSVGRLEVFPNSPNTVPGEALLFIELRSASPDVLAEAEERLKAMIGVAAARADVAFEVRAIDRRAAGRMDAGLLGLAEKVAGVHGEPVVALDTVSGHDAVSLSAVCPALILAVPSVGGVIHHPTEFTTPEHRAFGAQILADMLLALATKGLSAIRQEGQRR